MFNFIFDWFWFYDDNFPLLIFCLSRKWDPARVTTTAYSPGLRLILFSKWSTTGGEREGITEGDHSQPPVTEEEVRRQLNILTSVTFSNSKGFAALLQSFQEEEQEEVEV